MDKKYSVLGASGDIGISFLKYLSLKPISVKAYARSFSTSKIPIDVCNHLNINICEIDTIFSKKTIENIFHDSDGVFNFIGMVSLNFSPELYPNIILTNSVLPGLLRLHNKKNIPIQYISTQRVQNLITNPIPCEWLEQAQGFLEQLIEQPISSSKYIEAISSYLKLNPIPNQMNIYEISKYLGEPVGKLLTNIENIKCVWTTIFNKKNSW